MPVRVIDSRDAPGAAGARAKAARAAEGRLPLFVNADDVAADDWVERMAEALQEYEAVGGHIDDVSLNTGSVTTWRPPLTPGELPRPFGLLPMPWPATAACTAMSTSRSAGSTPRSTTPRKRPTCSGGSSWPA